MEEIGYDSHLAQRHRHAGPTWRRCRRWRRSLRARRDSSSAPASWSPRRATRCCSPASWRRSTCCPTGGCCPPPGSGSTSRASARRWASTASERAARLEEALAVIRLLWPGEPGDVRGPLLPADRCAPVADGRKRRKLEIWLGGQAPKALDRIGRIGDGWLASFVSPEDFGRKARRDSRRRGRGGPRDRRGPLRHDAVRARAARRRPGRRSGACRAPARAALRRQRRDVRSRAARAARALPRRRARRSSWCSRSPRRSRGLARRAVRAAVAPVEAAH